ncbi:hypothetical protein COU75_01240 [Candidatus Peregrinibacteria bacterium CG10_big_fil_rev_8_21_14_0_10_42_8]|nr:MAG: hypothetical protein COU75_01240 [Candidatus Peregrinibacteria bacterium CG10_big_fil_rev_8_21_14_0_10_42_8]
MSYSFTSQCQSECKKLIKKFRSLELDIERFCKFTLKLEEDNGFPGTNKNYTLLKAQGDVSVYKAKMPCTTLRGNKFRVIYARHEDSIEIIFIELYIKSESHREDKQRINDYLSQFN